MKKIFYFRYDENYQDMDIWAWNENQDGRNFQFKFKSDFGMACYLDLDADTNFIIRHKDWLFQEKSFSLTEADEYYLVAGDNIIYHDFESALEAKKPRISAAIMDEMYEIKIKCTHKIPEDVIFTCYQSGQMLALDNFIITDDFSAKLKIAKSYKLSPSEVLEIRVSKFFKNTRVKWRLALDNFAYDGNGLGFTRLWQTKDMANSPNPKEKLARLRLWSPLASSVELLFYQNANDENYSHHLSFECNRNNGLWELIFKDELTKIYPYYLYKISFFPNSPYANVTFAKDPYAYGVSVNGQKVAFVTLDDENTIPEQLLLSRDSDNSKTIYSWDNDKRASNLNKAKNFIYELHVRDFSIHKSSGIRQEWRGKFLAFCEENTVVPGTTIKTGLNHLAELGISHVHLLPVNDFASVDEAKQDNPYNRNWGYDPQFYNAIEGSYCTDASKPALRLKEFRTMVMALHAKDIGVIVDVVYNHMYSTTYLDSLVPFYYFRSDDNGNYTNGSGCGNELASERKMVRKLIKDSCKYWCKNFHLDGLRFDLMGLIDIDTMKLIARELKELDDKIIIYGEPWAGGISALDYNKMTLDGSQRGKNFAMFNDCFRDAIRGSNEPGRGYVNLGQKQEDIESIKIGLKGSIEDFCADATESINYVEVHDNYNLFDQLLLSTMNLQELKEDFKLAANSNTEEIIEAYQKYLRSLSPTKLLENDLVKRLLLAMGLITFSQGPSLMQAGTEFLRTKKGDHNSYKSPDYINQINWENKKDFYPVFKNFVRLLKFKKQSKILGLIEASKILQNIEIYQLKEKNEIIVMLIKNNDELQNLIFFNPSTEIINVSDDPYITGLISKKQFKISFGKPSEWGETSCINNVESLKISPLSLLQLEIIP